MNRFTTSATQVIESLRHGRLSAEEVMAETLDRIDQVNPKVNALIQRRSREELLNEARTLDRQKSRGLLHGLPMTVKDGITVRGIKCSLGCKGGYIRVADQDAVVVQRLRAAGAIVIGQTNIPEGMCALETDNLLYGRTNNPYDLSRVAGGSSGGEAAAIASGCSFLGVASDAAGSIRIPAHCCGIAGIKPSQGLVPMLGRITGDGLIGQIAVFGTMGRCIDECELALSIIAGVHPSDPYALPIPLQPSTSVDLSKLRIGYYTEDGVITSGQETVFAVEEAIEALRRTGADVERVRFDCLAQAHDLIWEAFFAPGAAVIKSAMRAMGVEEIHPLFDDFLKRAMEKQRSATDLVLAHAQLGIFRQEMTNLVQPYDLLVSPVMGEPAVTHGESWWNNFAAVHNLTGWPSVTVRCGSSSQGLPIGLQLVAKRWCDQIAIAAARHIERTVGGYQPPSL